MIPPNVEPAVRMLCDLPEARLPDAVESVYLYGSIALDAYVEGSSDIDFVAFVKRPLTEEDLAAMADIHKAVDKAWPGLQFMGSYLCREDAGKEADAVTAFPSYFNERLDPNGAHADLNPVTWWILKKRGICVYGTDAPFAYEIPANALVRYVIGNMNTYWHNQVNRLEHRLLSLPDDPEGKLPPERLDEAVEWCVLGMLRQHYTIVWQDVTSKLGAGAYGLELLPERWHGLIREALAGIRFGAFAASGFGRTAALY
ncbi:nucleotidyltransferase domain-containing protein [Paenibacillus allorhizosphaerae]|uniref:Polymerase nucleotidyl transferase domain-containing protein n=1 Tax=Paenibacillus allorhizosphaerae TaxID=2849866 RepID=A0ABM8VFX3_9BACL|nr:nucleotidyltransferase domain-containing protein [Paenibacillus allorhizosphaerae]CAG7636152.1 hypothetical protein PAECIP111802_02223 [Paenibacillus allorhizosphaerae]